MSRTISLSILLSVSSVKLACSGAAQTDVQAPGHESGPVLDESSTQTAVDADAETSIPAENEQDFSFLEGTWAGPNASCAEQPFTISIDKDQSILTIEYRDVFEGPLGAHTTFRYEIRSISQGTLTLFSIEPEETRLSDNGDLVVWELVALGDTQFHWRGQDWPEGRHTPPALRCEGGR